jgi:hypothetical protein
MVKDIQNVFKQLTKDEKYQKHGFANGCNQLKTMSND